MRNVTVIPPSIDRYTTAPISSKAKRKVAAYARVSTEQEEQQSSYEAQVDYYTNYIKSRDDWEFVSVYADAGITGTSTCNREGFKRMINDAIAGKIDLIVTKSVSRFARNTVDSLTNIRLLKEHGTEIFFEKEQIWTFQNSGEILLTLLVSMSQEESRSISENVLWGVRKKMSDGKFSMSYSTFLGYDKGEDGTLVINEEQAVVIRKIYKLYLEGLSTHTIAKILTEEGIKTPKGKDKWSQSTVLSILTNEKYSGNAVLQKTYTESFLTHKSVKNDGRLPQYYVEDSHPAIVSNEIFELVQQERERRKKTEGHYSGHNIFSSKIICGECGHFYGSKLWHSTDKYRCTVYRCNQKYKKGEGHIKCGTPHLKEEQIKACFIVAVNELIKNKNEIISNLETAKKLLCNNAVIEKECSELQKELNVIVNKVQMYISENARVVQDQAEYRSRYNELVGKYESLKTQIEEKEQQISDNIAKSRIFDVFIKELKKQQGLVTEFDENLWCSLVESMTVYSKEKIVVRFKNGMEIITAK